MEERYINKLSSTNKEMIRDILAWEKRMEVPYSNCYDTIRMKVLDFYNKVVDYYMNPVDPDYDSNDNIKVSLYNFLLSDAVNYNDRLPMIFIKSLQSFLSNCILDDSFYKLEWKKYTTETIVFTGTLKREIPDFDKPLITTTKEDPDSFPVVTSFVCDDNPLASQDIDPLIEALEYLEEEERERKVKWQKLLDKYKKVKESK